MQPAPGALNNKYHDFTLSPWRGIGESNPGSLLDRQLSFPLDQYPLVIRHALGAAYAAMLDTAGAVMVRVPPVVAAAQIAPAAQVHERVACDHHSPDNQ